MVGITVTVFAGVSIFVLNYFQSTPHPPRADIADDSTFWEGTPEEIADRLRPYVELGFTTVISEQPAPYDVETFERFIGEVKPLIDAG